jgi:hypothetical protein
VEDFVEDFINANLYVLTVTKKDVMAIWRFAMDKQEHLACYCPFPIARENDNEICFFCSGKINKSKIKPKKDGYKLQKRK